MIRYEKKIKINNKNYKKAADAHRRYIQFQESDLVMVPLRQDIYQKLQPKKMGPFQVLKQFGECIFIRASFRIAF